MASCALGGLNDDVAACELNHCVFSAHINAELGPLIHLHQRAITQAKHGVSAACGANVFAFCQFVADFQRLLTADAYAEKPTVERFHTRTHSRRATEIPCLREIRGDAEDHYGHCHSNP